MYSPSSSFVVAEAPDYSPTSSVGFSAGVTPASDYLPTTDFALPGGAAYAPTADFVIAGGAVDPTPGLTSYQLRLNAAWQLDAAVVAYVSVSLDMRYALIPTEMIGRLPVCSLQAHAYSDWTVMQQSLPVMTSVAMGAANGAGSLPRVGLTATGSGEWGHLAGSMAQAALMANGGAEAAGALLPIRLAATGSGEWGQLVTALPAWSVQGFGASHAHGGLTMASLTATTSPVWGVGAGVLPGLQSSGYAGASATGMLSSIALETQWGTLSGHLPGLTLSGEVTTGAASQLQGTIYLAPGVLGYGGAELSALFPRGSLSASATSTSQSRADWVLPRFSLYATASSESVAQLRGQVPLVSVQWGQLDGRLPRLGLASTPVQSQAGLGVESAATQPVNWCINLATGEMTSYTQFPFQRVVRLAGEFYGVNRTGLYRFGGQTNAGQPINVTLETAPMDFGSMMMKRVPYLYAGMSAGDARITSIIDGVSYGPFDTEHGHKRVRLPRGAKGRYWGFRLVNWQGGPFRLDGLDIVVEPTTRRI